MCMHSYTQSKIFCLPKAQWEAENHCGVFSFRGRLGRQCVLISSINDRREGTHEGEGESIPDIAQPWECADERGDLLFYLDGGPCEVGESGREPEGPEKPEGSCELHVAALGPDMQRGD